MRKHFIAYNHCPPCFAFGAVITPGILSFSGHTHCDFLQDVMEKCLWTVLARRPSAGGAELKGQRPHPVVGGGTPDSPFLSSLRKALVWHILFWCV